MKIEENSPYKEESNVGKLSWHKPELRKNDMRETNSGGTAGTDGGGRGGSSPGS